MVLNTDYKIDSITPNIEEGKGTVTFSGINNYTGTVTKTYIINKNHIESCDIEMNPKEFIYNGIHQRPQIVIKDGGKTLTEGTDYELTWNDTEAINAKGGDSFQIAGKGIYDHGNGGAYKIAADLVKNNDKTTITVDDLIKFAKMLVGLE